MTPETAVQRYPNLFNLSSDGVLEIYADNHILSSYRKCPGYFVESILERRGTKGRNWSLEFGQYFHKVMEYFYKAQKEEWTGEWWYGDVFLGKQDLPSFLNVVKFHWDEYNLEDFIDHPSYKKLGGYLGAFNLFLQYYNTHFQTERLRVVGTELSFGRAKEVPIHQEGVLIADNSLTHLEPANKCYRTNYTQDVDIVRFYYCGRIDLVVDDSSIIGPMDHKTTSYFDGTESSGFKPHDGMQGYVYSFQKMLPENLKAEGRSCNSIYINHISLQTAKDDSTGSKRFKHSIISYTPAEMEEWRLRQVRTFTDIYRTVILEEPVSWDTERCDQWYGFNPCPYKQLHAAAPLSREVVAKSNFIQVEPWSHERV